jgi:hypothetical protein
MDELIKVLKVGEQKEINNKLQQFITQVKNISYFFFNFCLCDLKL